MLPFLFALVATTSASAAAHPLCPYNDRAARAKIAPSAREEMKGLGGFFEDFSARFGKCKGVTEGDPGKLRYEGAEIPWRATRDRQGRITGLSFGPASFPGDSIAALKADVEKMGAAFFARYESGEEFGSGAEDPREVGELAHLLWLREYRRAVKEERLKTDSIVRTKGPSPVLSLGPVIGWPAATPLTAEAAALLAFRSRDNLAADLLLDLIGGKIEGKAVEPYGQLALATKAAARGWRHSLRSLCEAALAVKEDPVFENGEGAAADRNRFYEFQGEFPHEYAVLQLSQAKPSAPYACAVVAFSDPGELAFKRARDFLDRAVELKGEYPAGNTGQAAGKLGR